MQRPRLSRGFFVVRKPNVCRAVQACQSIQPCKLVIIDFYYLPSCRINCHFVHSKAYPNTNFIYPAAILCVQFCLHNRAIHLLQGNLNRFCRGNQVAVYILSAVFLRDQHQRIYN